jgi:hypothetical protein
MYRIKRSHIRLLNQFFGLQENWFTHLHKFPITSVLRSLLPSLRLDKTSKLAPVCAS